MPDSCPQWYGYHLVLTQSHLNALTNPMSAVLHTGDAQDGVEDTDSGAKVILSS